MRTRSAPRNTVLLLAFASAFLAPHRARAAAYNLLQSGAWNVAENWSPSGGPPTASDIATIGGGFTAIAETGVTGVATDINVGGSSGTGVLDISGGTITLSGWMRVGEWNTGTLQLSSGTLSAQYANVGTYPSVVGTATISGGTWNVAADLYVGNQGNGTINLNGGTISANGGTGTITVASWAGDSNGTYYSSNGTLNIGTGGTAGTLQAATVNGGAGTAVVNFNHTDDLAFAPSLTGSLSVKKLGNGTTTVSAANTYAGNTTISDGTWKAGSAGAIPSGSGKGNVVLNGGAGIAGMLDLNGNNLSINGLAGTNSTHHGQVVNNATETARTLTLGNNDATAGFAGVIADHTTGTGTLALTKTGSGTQTLTGANTYTGATTVSGGSLVVSTGTNGSLVNTSQVIVTTGGSLLVGASEVVNNSAAVSLGGGTLGFSGNATSATETLGTLTLTATSTLDFGISGTTFKFSSASPAAYTLNIANWTYNSNHLVFSTDQSGRLGSFQFNNGFAATQVGFGGGGYEIIAVPEPGTILAGGILLAGLTLAERRRLRRLCGRAQSCLPASCKENAGFPPDS